MSGIRNITYTRSINPALKTLQKADGTDTFSRPLTFNDNSRRYLRLLSASIPSNIPNIISQYDNNSFGIALTDMYFNVIHSTTIVLADGIYTPSSLNDAINNWLNQYYIDTTDRGFQLRENSTLQRCYFEINMAKFNPLLNAEGIRFNFTSGDFATVIGFDKTNTVYANGLHVGTMTPLFDYFGTKVNIILRGFGDLSVINGDSSEYLTAITIDGKNLTSDCPKYGEQFEFSQLETTNRVNSFSVSLVGSKGNKPIYFSDGEIIINFCIKEEFD